MSTVRMKAVYTLHISSLGQHALMAGAEFEIDEAYAGDLETRGLAKRVGGAKKEPAPQNKMEPAPQNKSENPEAAPDGASRKPISGGGDAGFTSTDAAPRGRKPKKG